MIFLIRYLGLLGTIGVGEVERGSWIMALCVKCAWKGEILLELKGSMEEPQWGYLNEDAPLRLSE
jgi:hypothetical protein